MILQNSVVDAILLFVLLSGASASTANANDVQDYIDSLTCDNSNYPLPDALQEECDNFEQLRNCQAYSVVSLYPYLKLNLLWTKYKLLYS